MRIILANYKPENVVGLCCMCGIVGFYEKIVSDTDQAGIINEMIRLINHRGPDDNGFESLPLLGNRNLMMGFVRLSILDLSAAGHQPMFNHDKTICISFNGEIYNAFSYRKELVEKGYVFRSHTDTEIVLFLYEEYGIEGMLRRINGMFAIAIADMRCNKLYLVRDRMGVKPLYYYDSDKVLIYGSEIKAFYAQPFFENTINWPRIKENLLFRYVAGEETLLNGVTT